MRDLAILENSKFYFFLPKFQNEQMQFPMHLRDEKMKSELRLASNDLKKRQMSLYSTNSRVNVKDPLSGGLNGLFSQVREITSEVVFTPQKRGKSSKKYLFFSNMRDVYNYRVSKRSDDAIG